jgi:hypothetical protein
MPRICFPGRFRSLGISNRRIVHRAQRLDAVCLKERRKGAGLVICIVDRFCLFLRVAARQETGREVLDPRPRLFDLGLDLGDGRRSVQRYSLLSSFYGVSALICSGARFLYVASKRPTRRDSMGPRRYGLMDDGHLEKGGVQRRAFVFSHCRRNRHPRSRSVAQNTKKKNHRKRPEGK